MPLGSGMAVVSRRGGGKHVWRRQTDRIGRQNFVVCAAMTIQQSIPVPSDAPATEAALSGKPWTEETVRAGMEALATDYAPLSDMRASAAYRRQAAQNLLHRFFLETRPDDPMLPKQVSVYASV